MRTRLTASFTAAVCLTASFYAATLVNGQVAETREAPGAAAGAARTPTAARGAGVVRETTFDDIKFDMVKGTQFKRSLLTPQIEALAGKRIRIRGYIHPASAFTQTVTQFVLVRDNQECCFGPGAALFDCIVVRMEPGKTAAYTIHPVTVEGAFAIDELVGPDGSHLAIYALTAVSVE